MPLKVFNPSTSEKPIYLKLEAVYSQIILRACDADGRMLNAGNILSITENGIRLFSGLNSNVPIACDDNRKVKIL